MTTACLQLAIDSAPENVRVVRRAVAEAAAHAGADVPTVGDIALAVDEAMSNAVRHAYPYMPTRGCVYVSAERDDGTFAVVVRDDGRGFIPDEDKPPAEDGGFGLKLIGELAREFTIVSGPDRGTEVHMVFALGDSH